MVTLYATLITIILGCLGSAGAFFYGEKVGTDREIAKQAKVEDAIQRTAAAAQDAAAKAIAANKPKNVTIRQEVEREIQTETRYRDCVHSDQQLRRINAAITGGYDPEPAGSGLVPRVDALGGPLLRGNDAQADRGRGTVP